MTRRTAIIADANTHVGPPLAKLLGERDHDLVLGEPSSTLVEELRASQPGTRFEAVHGVENLADPESIGRLVDSAHSRFGRFDCACIRTGRILRGSFLESTPEDLELEVEANLTAVYMALKGLLPPLIEHGGGQIMIITSATGAHPQNGSSLYSATRAAANMLVKNVALEVAPHGISLNALGTNFLEYPGFLNASGATEPATRKAIESRIPLRRLGQPEEVAHFCASLLDGKSTFQTGQFFSFAGGWGQG
jgi:3-oxoacyl-[acyl-carrier protein] reductase